MAGLALLAGTSLVCSGGSQAPGTGGTGGRADAGDPSRGGGTAGAAGISSGGSSGATGGQTGTPAGGTGGGAGVRAATGGTGAGGRLGSGGAAGAGGLAGVAGSSGGGGGAPRGGVSWFPVDLTFTSTAGKANPYSDVTDFQVTFTGPTGGKLIVPGFYVGNDVWKVRFAPTGPGTFTYVTSSVQDPSLNGKTGTVPAAAANPNGHGALAVDSAFPRHYLYEDGTRPFQMGYELDWLALMDFGDPNITRAKTIIDMVAAHGFTEVLMNAYASDSGWETGTTSANDFGPTAQIPWAGTNASPDHSRMNEAFWQSVDRVLAYLFEKGINAHIYFRVYTKAVSWPANGSAQDDLYFRYIVARYQAYANVIWDFSKESYYEKDQTYIAGRLALIRAADGYHHLRTAHDSDGPHNTMTNYYDVAAHAGTVELYTDQSNAQYATAVAALRKRSMPYYNAEVTLYQVGNDGTYTYSQHNPAADVFAASMEVVMAGGYFAYYYSLQAWDVVKVAEVPAGIAWYANLARTMKTTHWYKLSANDALIGGGAIGSHCLAAPGSEYVVYQHGAGSVTLTIAGAATPLSAKWVDLVTGTESPLAAQTNGARTFTNPGSDPALLVLTAPGP